MSPIKHLVFTFLVSIFLIFSQVSASFDYGAALTKSILYYEAQRAGKLPPTQRVTWRGDSSLHDGSQNQIDLSGGYYDAGDNVKYGFPMAYTITMLSWGVIEFSEKLSVKNELENAYAAIKWGTDYLIKAHPEPDVLYAEVGEGNSDHQCWQRPEDMGTPRTVFKIDVDHPGSDLAGETAAAFAAASIVFKNADPNYSNILLRHAKQLFHFAETHPGIYSESVPVADKFYHSSDNQDEFLWAAAWLFRATNDLSFIHYIEQYDGYPEERSMFSWDDKHVGVQVLISKMYDALPHSDIWEDYKTEAENFICNVIGKGYHNVKRSNGGLVWWDPWNNLQYTTAAAFVVTVYAKHLSKTGMEMDCPEDIVHADDLFSFARSQVDYILGANPKNMSYMVGFGENYPKKVHHRGASIVSYKTNSTLVTCQGGFDLWFRKDAPNPNVLEGAIVGGPYDTDEYIDSRESYQQAEPAIANNAPLVGVLAYLA